jgi:hypothetical protein
MMKHVRLFHQQTDNSQKLQHENTEWGGILIHMWCLIGFLPHRSTRKMVIHSPPAVLFWWPHYGGDDNGGGDGHTNSPSLQSLSSVSPSSSSV